MSQPDVESRSKRLIKLETRVRTGSDPTLYYSNGSEQPRLPFADTDVGQPCLKCGGKCHGFMAHTWRKSCITCGCARDCHKTEQLISIPDIQGLSISEHTHLTVQERRVRSKYAWYPTDANPDLVEQYMRCLPKEFVPVRGSNGEKERTKLFRTQLPAHDSVPETCHKMAELDKKRMRKFVDRRMKKFFGVGEVGVELDEKVCAYCGEVIEQGSIKVTAARDDGDQAWHPRCFRCGTCKQLLVDLYYFYSPESGEILCGRHHGERIVPRCVGCDELIFSDKYTESGGRKWHGDHFCCDVCDENLKGKPFKEDEGSLLCARCFDKTTATKCQKCREPISIGTAKVSSKGHSWHKECFVCKRCREDLLEEQFFLISDDLLCAECVEPVAQCYSCKSAISPVVSYLQHSNRCWHAGCFKCVICHAWLADGQFHEMDGSLMCRDCYVEKVGKKCGKCKKPVVGKGVQFGFKAYHPECFICKICDRTLGDQNIKVKEKDGDPVCEECNQKLAMKCFKCRAPITSRHTVYKGHPFHLSCFTCNTCGSSVAKSEFFETSLNQILCMKCAQLR